MGKYPTNHDYLPVCSYEWMTSSLQTVKSGTIQTDLHMGKCPYMSKYITY